MTSTGCGGRPQDQVTIGMAKKTVEESEQTCFRLMETGTRMFAEYGYAYSTLDDIAKCAGLSRGALYGHIKGNRELLLSIMNASVLPLEGFFVPAADPAQGFEHFARALNDTLNVQHHRDFCTILLKDGEIGAPECPVVVRWHVARKNLRAQLTLLLIAMGKVSTQRTAAELKALAHLMALSNTGLIIESLHSPEPTETLTRPLVHTIQELVSGSGIPG
jgi:AcrR family transcriptional regulator